MGDSGDHPPIIIDSDWKSQAQAEKQRLADQEKPAASKAGAGDMPPADFRALVGSLATQALLYMGAFPDPETGQAMVSLEYAKHAIDLLGVLEAKTKGNLNEEEQQDITEVLHELRQRFVQVTQILAKSQAQRAAGAPGRVPGAGPASPFTST